MYKHVACLAREEGTSHESFVDRWESLHAAVGRIEGVARYHAVLPVNPDVSEFDGLAELYAADLDALRAVESAGSAPADAIGFLAERRRAGFTGEEVVQRDDVDGDTDGLYKHSAFLVRKEGMSHEAFVDHWQNRHTPIAREIEGVVKYNTVLPADPERAAFDGVAELYFADLDALHDALGSEGERDYDPAKGTAKEAREDVDNFLAVSERPRFIGRETVRAGGV